MESLSPARAEDLLLRAARACGGHLRQTTRDDVQRALADTDHGPALAEWATVHLRPDTLLTADELAL